MANIILNLTNNRDNNEQLEKYVDLDMESIYKSFAHPENVDKAAFNKEQDSNPTGQFYSSTDDSLMTLDKTFKKTIDVDYSGYKIAKNINVKAVQDSIRNIFTWFLGERILQPEFGSKLRRYLYEGIIPSTEEQINAEIRQCISIWEPRARIVNIYNVSSTDDTENNTIHLEIVYTIPELSDKQYSYSYYFNKNI